MRSSALGRAAGGSEGSGETAVNEEQREPGHKYIIAHFIFTTFDLSNMLCLKVEMYARLPLPRVCCIDDRLNQIGTWPERLDQTSLVTRAPALLGENSSSSPQLYHPRCVPAQGNDVDAL